jgi:hypothetical protein
VAGQAGRADREEAAGEGGGRGGRRSGSRAGEAAAHGGSCTQAGRQLGRVPVDDPEAVADGGKDAAVPEAGQDEPAEGARGGSTRSSGTMKCMRRKQRGGVHAGGGEGPERGRRRCSQVCGWGCARPGAVTWGHWPTVLAAAGSRGERARCGTSKRGCVDRRRAAWRAPRRCPAGERAPCVRFSQRRNRRERDACAAGSACEVQARGPTRRMGGNGRDGRWRGRWTGWCGRPWRWGRREESATAGSVDGR